MTKLFKLIKISFLHGLSLNKLSKKHNAKRSLAPIILTIILTLYLFAVASFLFFTIGNLLNEIGHLDYLLILGYSIGSVFCLSYTITKANGILFEAKDFDLLMTLPVKTSYIVTSKLATLVLMNYLLLGFCLFPTLVIYSIFVGADILLIILSIVSYLVAPLLIISVCTFISYILDVIFGKFKNKSIIISIISIVIFIAFIFGYTFFINRIQNISQDDINVLADMITNVTENMGKVFIPARLMAEGLQGNILSFVEYVLFMIIPFIILVLIVSKNFLKANMRTRNMNSKSKLDLSKQKKNSVIKAIMKRDFKRAISSSSVFMNVAIGPIMSIVMTATLCFSFKSNSADLTESGILLMVFAFASAFGIGMMPSTASTISLEGKNFWIIKSSPISVRDYFLSKILFYVVLCLPAIIISPIIVCVFGGLSVIDGLLICGLNIVFTFLYALEGLIINIYSHKFDWDSEIRAVKQGTSSFLSMLLGFAIDIVIFLPTILLSFIGVNGIVILYAISILILVILYLVLKYKGKKKFLSIEI